MDLIRCNGLCCFAIRSRAVGIGHAERSRSGDELLGVLEVDKEEERRRRMKIVYALIVGLACGLQLAIVLDTTVFPWLLTAGDEETEHALFSSRRPQGETQWIEYRGHERSYRMDLVFRCAACCFECPTEDEVERHLTEHWDEP